MNEITGERRFPPWMLQDWVLGYPGMPTNLIESGPPQLPPWEPPLFSVRKQATVTELRNVCEVPMRTSEETKCLRREVRMELKEELDKKRKKARRKLFEEIRAARARLQQLSGVEAAVAAARAYLAQLQSRCARGAPDYPEPPLPMIKPSTDGGDLPETSGIYFLCEGEMVAYVGKAVNLRNRLRLGTHHALRATDTIAHLPFSPVELNWAESFYIGVLRPARNFGQNAFHRKYGETEPI